MRLIILLSVFLLIVITNPVGASANSTPGILVANPSGQAAMIRWTISADHFTGTYESYNFVVSLGAAAALSNHCLISGSERSSAISVTFSHCEQSITNGTYAGFFHGKSLYLTLPAQSSPQETLVPNETLAFRPGSTKAYDEAMSAVDLIVSQPNGLTIYLELNRQTPTPYYQPIGSQFFKIGPHWYDIVAQQTNSASDHAGAVARLFVIRWGADVWTQIASFPLTSDTGPIPGTPTSISLGRNIVAFAFPLTWMTYASYEVVAFINSKWQLVPFGTETKLASDFLWSSSSTSIEGSKIIRTLNGCVGHKCSTATITYTFNAHSSDGPLFAVTGLAGPAIDFEHK